MCIYLIVIIYSLYVTINLTEYNFNDIKLSIHTFVNMVYKFCI